LHCVVLPLRGQGFRIDKSYNLNGPRSLDTFPFKKIMYNSILAYVCPLLTKLCPSKDLNHKSAQIVYFFNPSFWGPPSGTLRKTIILTKGGLIICFWIIYIHIYEFLFALLTLNYWWCMLRGFDIRDLSSSGWRFSG